MNGFRPYPGMFDINGEPVEDRLYEQKDFVLEERTKTVAKRVSDFLKETNRYLRGYFSCGAYAPSCTGQ